MNALFIAGTDTDVGKTALTLALAAYWQTYGGDRTLGVMKPIQSGVGDLERYQQILTLDQSPPEITPLYFQAPLAPPIAAAREGRTIDLALIWQAFTTLQREKSFVLVESLGGLGSPITGETTVADWAWDWRIPTVLVVPVRLGAIAQAVANVALARQSKILLRGIVLNCTEPRSPEDVEQWTPPLLIQTLTQVPVLGCLPYLDDLTDIAKLTHAAADLCLERLLPPLTCTPPCVLAHPSSLLK